MNNPDLLLAIEPIIDCFNALNISYQIGGSVASSACGVPRTTLDVDFVAIIEDSQVSSLVVQLQEKYYISADAIRDAIRNKSSFNLVHLETMIKADVFISKKRPYDQESFRRRRKEVLGEESIKLECFFTSPEDIILNKLVWYQMGNKISERQWSDVLGVMKVQGTSLDLPYLRHWANDLGVNDLLEQTMGEAGLVR